MRREGKAGLRRGCVTVDVVVVVVGRRCPVQPTGWMEGRVGGDVGWRVEGAAKNPFVRPVLPP